LNVLSAKVLWPLFPLLLLVVVVCLTAALVRVVRRSAGTAAIWLQAAALACYLLAAVAAIGSERGAMSAGIHRPFSFLTQVLLVSALFYFWRRGDRPLLVLNGSAWGAILADTALHYLLR
jgi:hypothetical protein